MSMPGSEMALLENTRMVFTATAVEAPDMAVFAYLVRRMNTRQ
jgi:hypothetical protein